MAGQVRLLSKYFIGKNSKDAVQVVKAVEQFPQYGYNRLHKFVYPNPSSYLRKVGIDSFHYSRNTHDGRWTLVAQRGDEVLADGLAEVRKLISAAKQLSGRNNLMK